jgi:hypothetical protein
MAAGLGFKTFAVGEVLTAADTNGYLMQGVLVFASAAARDAAITSPQEGQFAYTKDTNGLWYYDGAAWVASGATGDIEGVTAGVGISGGGTSGTVTVTNSMATAITTAGDLIYGTGSGTFTRRAIGSTGNVLTVAGGVPTWAAPAGGGSNWTLLNAGGTTLSGYTTVSGITGKEKLLIRIDGATNTTQTIIGLRINNDSTNGQYMQMGFQVKGVSTYNSNYLEAQNPSTASSIAIGRLPDSGGDVSGGVLIDGGSQTGFKSFVITGSGSSNPNQRAYAQTGIYLGSATISEINILSASGSLNGGKVFVYGA